MSEDPTRRVAMAGDEIKARVGVSHVANLTGVSVFFEMVVEGEEDRNGLPEIILQWRLDDVYDARPEHGLYGADNVRPSVYEVRGTVPADVPPGVYQLRGISFHTEGQRFVRYGRDRLEELEEGITSVEIEILDEQAERTRPTDLGFVYDE